MNRPPTRGRRPTIYRGGMSQLAYFANRDYVSAEEAAALEADAKKDGPFVPRHPDPDAPSTKDFAEQTLEQKQAEIGTAFSDALSAKNPGDGPVVVTMQSAGPTEAEQRDQYLPGFNNVMDYNEANSNDENEDDSGIEVPAGDATLAKLGFSGTCRLCSQREADCMLSTGQPICRNCARSWLQRDTTCPWTGAEIEWCRDNGVIWE